MLIEHSHRSLHASLNCVFARFPFKGNVFTTAEYNQFESNHTPHGMSHYPFENVKINNFRRQENAQTVYQLIIMYYLIPSIKQSKYNVVFSLINHLLKPDQFSTKMLILFFIFIQY